MKKCQASRSAEVWIPSKADAATKNFDFFSCVRTLQKDKCKGSAVSRVSVGGRKIKVSRLNMTRRRLLDSNSCCPYVDSAEVETRHVVHVRRLGSPRGKHWYEMQLITSVVSWRSTEGLMSVSPRLRYVGVKQDDCMSPESNKKQAVEVIDSLWNCPGISHIAIQEKKDDKMLLPNAIYNVVADPFQFEQAQPVIGQMLKPVLINCCTVYAPVSVPSKEVKEKLRGCPIKGS